MCGISLSLSHIANGDVGERESPGPRPWQTFVRDIAATELGCTDDFGNLVDWAGNPVHDA